MSLTDLISRITQIQSEMASLTEAFTPPSTQGGTQGTAATGLISQALPAVIIVGGIAGFELALQSVEDASAVRYRPDAAGGLRG